MVDVAEACKLEVPGHVGGDNLISSTEHLNADVDMTGAWSVA